MERRVLLAIFLAFIVLYTWQALFVKPVPKPVTGAAPATSATATPAGAVAPTGSNDASAASAGSVAVAKPAAPLATALVADTAERDVRVETRDVIAVFTNKGARLKSWRLKHYVDQQKEPQELIEHLPSQPLPFTLRAGSESTTQTVNDALYTVSGAPAAAVDAPVDLRFEYRDSAGVHAVKEFHLEPASYIFTFHGSVSENGKAVPLTVMWGPAVGDLTELSRYIKKAEGLLFQDSKVVRLASKDIAKQSSYDNQFHYAGVDDNYFMVVSLSPDPLKISFTPITVPPPAGTKDAARELMSFSIEPHNVDPSVKFFAGPKDFDVLSAIDRDLAKSIDFGMFTVIVVPLLRSLKWVNGYVGNWGWSIILLTFFINVILFPLRHKSVVSMRKMQEIQPQVKAIQDRYKNFKATDPEKQKMNTEMMALYKEKGVNPASGCVPMLLTMPFIFAFYALLSTAIELRGAPFLFWIHDLSAHDPYFVTPILMGISQLWQQRLAPATGMDPVQQKMTMLMPIFFTFLFLWYPAGVALYWLINNVFAIGQQYATNYMIGPPKVAAGVAGGSASERRMKRVGGGKTDAAAREMK
jgi:YidC/Oxa1 family membrane protein insertase